MTIPAMAPELMPEEEEEEDSEMELEVDWELLLVDVEVVEVVVALVEGLVVVLRLVAVEDEEEEEEEVVLGNPADTTAPLVVKSMKLDPNTSLPDRCQKKNMFESLKPNVALVTFHTYHLSTKLPRDSLLAVHRIVKSTSNLLAMVNTPECPY